MARKRTKKSRRAAKSKPRNPQFWSGTDRLQLLAYLNWCVQYGVKFRTTATEYLKKTTGKQFSERQIRYKLYSEWFTYGKCPKFDDLFVQGTAGLEPIQDEEQQDFQQILAGIEPPCGRRLRSASLAFRTRSRTLSTTRSTRGATSSREPHEAPRSHPRDREAAEKGSKRTNNNTKVSKSTRPGVSHDLSEDELAMEHIVDVVKGEDGSELSTAPSPERSDMELDNTPAIPDSEDEMVIDSPEPSQNLAIESTLREAKAELLKQKSYVFTLTNRLSEMQREVNELEHCHRAANSEQFNLRNQVSRYKSKLEAKERLERDFEALRTDSLAFPMTSIKKEFELLYHNISDTSSLICDMSADDTLPEQRSDFPQSAQTWAMQISGWDLGHLLTHSEAERIPKHKLIASLIAAGVFELILGPVFPAILAADSPLLDQYRKHILTRDGRKALQQLDLAAIKSLMAEESVKTAVITEKTKWLSLLITRTLSCFLPPQSRDINQRSLPDDAEKEMMGDLENTLSRALSIKMDLTLSVKRYKFVFFKPGTEFNAENMQDNGLQADGSMLENQGIKLCLIPALFSLLDETDDGGGPDAPSRFTMNYHESLTETDPADMESLVIVSKAIVLL